MKLTEQQNEELKRLFGIVWKKRNGEVDEKMVDFCMKDGKYIFMNGLYIYCCKAKPTINNSMWYDDTMKDPGTSYKRFCEYNTRYSELKPLELLSHGEKLILRTHYGNKPENLKCFDYSEDPAEREVTAAELKAINEARKEVSVDYEKRLKTYYKKYSKNIRSSGYWADR